MSTILNTNGAELSIPAVEDPDFSVDIVTAEWNPDITMALRDAAGLLVGRGRSKAVIIIGCVIRGDTPHFDYVCMQAAQGAAIINARGETPLIFGVLTVDNLEQAQERAGGVLGNKGSEAAVAAIQMANLHHSLS